MGQFLTTESVMMCPHGGSVTAITTNTATQAVGAYVVRSTDTFIVAGCAFTLPPAVPSPCVTVQWQVSELRVRANAPTLSASSQGLCISVFGVPQEPLIVHPSQTTVKSK